MLRQGSWQFASPLVACAALLAVAAWGAFHSHGTYEPQPVLGKIALIISIAFGTTIVIPVAAVFISYILPGSLVHQATPQYVMLSDGAIYTQTYHGNGTLRLQDLQGNVLKDVRGFNDLQGRQAP
jgi:phosphoglycerol transferase MdoB-like AlkP superfamily enzyme